MKRLLLVILLIAGFDVAAQRPLVGGPCEGCEAIFESPVPFEKLTDVAKLPDATWHGKKPLGINGIVYKADGRTPAADVVLYLYHTDESGKYAKKGDEKGWGKRHGYIRGWVKTNAKGEYKFVTLRPGVYPDRTEPAHIHVTIKEPGLNPYYVDEFVFDDDSLLTPAARQKLEHRGGSGVLKLIDVGNMYKAERHIYLGRNIPGYPGGK